MPSVSISGISYAGLAWGLIAAGLVGLNLVAMVLAGRRWMRAARAKPVAGTPPVTILRPLCNIEEFSDETLAANFSIEWPNYEVIFCVQRLNDPIIPLVERAIEAHPHVPARLLVGDDPVTANPKLNNCLKGWRAARHDWIVLADSNAVTPPDYLQRLVAVWREDTGLVVSMPLGTRPKTFFATVECTFLNAFQARWQYASEAIGEGFAQGKNMLWRRDIVDGAGGLATLGEQPAEDAAATRLVRAQGLSVHLVDRPFEQPLGTRSARDVWSRQARWARLRRATFPLQFLPEILTGAVAPLVATSAAATLLDGNIGLAIAGVATLLYSSELMLTRLARFPLDWRTLPAMILRDLWLPALYVDAWLTDSFTWHGHAMTVAEQDPEDLVGDAHA